MNNNKRLITKSIDFKLNLILLISFSIIPLILYMACVFQIENMGWIVGLIFVIIFLPFILYYFIKVVTILINIKNYKIVDAEYIKIVGFGAFYGIKVRFTDDYGIVRELETKHRLFGFGLAQQAQGQIIKIGYLKDNDKAIIIDILKSD